MKLKHLLSIISISILLFNSCSKSPLEDFNSSSDAMVVVSDAGLLNKRTSVANAGPIAIINKMAGRKLLANTNGNSLETFSPEIGLDLIKEIFPPTINGVLVRVTHVAIHGNYAYVGYNREGDVRAGAIDILDITNIDDVKLIKHIGLPNIDISTVYADGSNSVHFSGAADVGPIKGIATPAVAGFFNNTNNTPTLSALQSFSGTTATDFVFDEDYKYVVSGSLGELVKISKSNNEIVARVSAPGLLAVRANKEYIVALSADNGLMFYNKDLTPIKSFATVRNNVEHKRHIQIDNNYAYVAEGTAGLGIYDINSGELKNRITIPTNVKDFPFVGEHEVTTIAMSFDNNRAFVANGAGGISIYKHGNDKSDLTYLGSADLNFFQNRDNNDRPEGTVDVNEISSNYILAQGNIVFVAGGRGGLKILKLTDLSNEPDPESPNPTNNCFDCSNSNVIEYIGAGNIELKIDDERRFSGDKIFTNILLNKNLTWCGNLTGNEFNSNGSSEFKMSGELTINNNLTISTMVLCGVATIKGRTNLNSNGIGLTIKNKSTFSTREMDVNTKIIVEERGILNITGAGTDFKINSNATVELANSTELNIEGNLMNSNTSSTGLSTGSNSTITVKGNVNTNNRVAIISLGGNSTFTVNGNYENNDGKLIIGAESTVIVLNNLIMQNSGSVQFGSGSKLKVYGNFTQDQNNPKYKVTPVTDATGTYKLITLL